MQVQCAASDWRLNSKVGNTKEINLVGLYGLGNHIEAGNQVTNVTPIISS